MCHKYALAILCARIVKDEKTTKKLHFDLDIMTELQHQTSSHPFSSKLKHWVPIVILVAVFVAFFTSGLHEKLTLDELALRYGKLHAYIQDNFTVAIIVSIGLYIVTTAASIPIALLLSIAIGLMFGWALGAFIIIVGATIGASILYFIAKSLAHDFFTHRAGKFLNVMAKGFRENSVSYMLFLRLAAIFPFSVVNVVPAILGVSFKIYFWTTAIGIIPGTLAYAYAGEGLRSIISERASACVNNITPCGEAFTAADIITKEMLIAFVLLALVSLLPIVLKKFAKSK